MCLIIAKLLKPKLPKTRDDEKDENSKQPLSGESQIWPYCTPQYLHIFYTPTNPTYNPMWKITEVCWLLLELFSLPCACMSDSIATFSLFYSAFWCTVTLDSLHTITIINMIPTFASFTRFCCFKYWSNSFTTCKTTRLSSFTRFTYFISFMF